jgi:hypothetical protein
LSTKVRATRSNNTAHSAALMEALELLRRYAHRERIQFYDLAERVPIDGVVKPDARSSCFGSGFVGESILSFDRGKSLIASSGLDGPQIAGDLSTIRDIQIHLAADWTPGKDDPTANADTPPSGTPRSGCGRLRRSRARINGFSGNGSRSPPTRRHARRPAGDEREQLGDLPGSDRELRWARRVCQGRGREHCHPSRWSTPDAGWPPPEFRSAGGRARPLGARRARGWGTAAISTRCPETFLRQPASDAASRKTLHSMQCGN